VQGLDPLGAGEGGGEALGDILGHVGAADGEAVHMDQGAVGVDRHRGGAAAHVDNRLSNSLDIQGFAAHEEDDVEHVEGPHRAEDDRGG